MCASRPNKASSSVAERGEIKPKHDTRREDDDDDEVMLDASSDRWREECSMRSSDGATKVAKREWKRERERWQAAWSVERSGPPRTSLC